MNIDEVKARVHALGQQEINKCIEEFHAAVTKFRREYSMSLGIASSLVVDVSKIRAPVDEESQKCQPR